MFNDILNDFSEYDFLYLESRKVGFTISNYMCCYKLDNDWMDIYLVTDYLIDEFNSCDTEKTLIRGFIYDAIIVKKEIRKRIIDEYLKNNPD